MSEERWLKVQDVCEILNVSRWTVYRWIRQHKLRAIKLPGGTYRIPESEIDRLLKGGENEKTS